MERIPTLHWILAACLTFLSAVEAGPPYYYTGAQWAVQAQCPAGYPISCNSISQGNYCCPTGQYCTWANAQVACCPDDCTCSGWSSGPAGYSSYQPHSSYVAPASSHYWHSSYRPEPSCNVCGEHTTTVIIRPQSQQSSQPSQVGPASVSRFGGYCSTVYAVGPGLPTSRQGDCGLVLYESPPPNAAGRSFETGFGLWMVSWVVGLQIVGGMALVWR